MKTYKPSTIRKYYYDIKNALEHHAMMHDYLFNSKPFDEVPLLLLGVILVIEGWKMASLTN